SEPAVGSDSAGRHAPGRDRVGELQLRRGPAQVVGDDLRQPGEGFGEVLTETQGRPTLGGRWVRSWWRIFLDRARWNGPAGIRLVAGSCCVTPTSAVI